MIGKTLGKYRIIEHLGTGGMAEVHKAYQPGLDRHVAIKVLHSFLATEESFLARFQREARLVAMLRHPNIIQVYDFEYDAEHNLYYMVMEYIDGPSLKVRLSEFSDQGLVMPLQEAVDAVAAIAHALEYAHERGMVHRDIKPANVMFNRDGQLVLSDFGIAKIVNLSALTASGAMVGTPAYMAPEQGMGLAGDERADIYSLGAVMYQLVTGQLPFDADTFMGIVLKHINEPLMPPSRVNPAVPAAVEAVICRAMTKDPANRYQTAKEFEVDLCRAAGKLPPNGGDLSVKTVTHPSPTYEHADTGLVATASGSPPVVSDSPSADEASGLQPRPRTSRRLAVFALGALLVILGTAIGAILTIGVARRFLAGVVMPTPSPLAAAGSPTAANDAVATQVAAALATYVATTGVTPTPSHTPTPTPTATPTPDASATALARCEYGMRVVSDQPLRSSVLRPGQEFTKRWQIEAVGNCQWQDHVELINVSGHRPEVIELEPVPSLSPGDTAEIAVTLRAPEVYGSYSSTWQLRLGDQPFGEELAFSFRVAPPPTPRPTSTPTPTLTPTLPLPSPTVGTREPLHFSVPVIVECQKLTSGKWQARVGITAWGGLGEGSYRYYQNYVSDESEFYNGTFDFEWETGNAWSGTVIVTSGEEQSRWRGSLPMPDDCK